MACEHTRRFAKQAIMIGFMIGAGLGLAACSERHEKIYQASETGGDYAILDCSELEVAERSIGQRLTGSTSYSQAGEPSALLTSQRSQIATTRSSRQCKGDPAAQTITPAEVVESRNSEILLQDGAYLQVATFREEANRDRTVNRLRENGFQTFVRPIQLAGQPYYRVIVGPITSVAQVASIDALTIRMGFNDTFFVKG